MLRNEIHRANGKSIWSRRKTKRFIFITLAIAPAFILYTLFYLYPIAESAAASFFDWSGLSSNMRFIGFANYRKLIGELTSPIGILRKAFFNDLYLTVLRIIFTVTLSFFFAEVLVRMNLKEKGLYKAIFFFPNVLSLVVVSTIWTFIYNPQFGLLNVGLKSIGLEQLARPWLADFDTVLMAIVPPSVWVGAGFYMVIFIAAIKGIPASIYESAMLDGANHVKQFFFITLPLVWDYIRIVIVLLLVHSFNANFVYVQIMTGGGPAFASWVLMMEFYQQAFMNHKFGYAAAVGVFATLIAIIYTIIFNKLLSREPLEY